MSGEQKRLWLHFLAGLLWAGGMGLSVFVLSGNALLGFAAGTICAAALALRIYVRVRIDGEPL